MGGYRNGESTIGGGYMRKKKIILTIMASCTAIIMVICVMLLCSSEERTITINGDIVTDSALADDILKFYDELNLNQKLEMQNNYYGGVAIEIFENGNIVAGFSLFSDKINIDNTYYKIEAKDICEKISEYLGKQHKSR